VAIHGAKIDRLARVPQPGQKTLSHGVSAIRAARMVGDHSMSRPVARRRFQRSMLMSSPRVLTPIARVSRRRSVKSIRGYVFLLTSSRSSGALAAGMADTCRMIFRSDGSIPRCIPTTGPVGIRHHRQRGQAPGGLVTLDG
jgi:hypothetical protein